VRPAVFIRRSVPLLFAALCEALWDCKPPGDRVLEETFRQIYTIEPTATITVHNGDGAVLVYGSNGNAMRVDAIKRAYTPKRLKQIAVKVSVDSGSVSIQTSLPKKPRWSFSDRSGTVDYTIVVPATASISKLNLSAGEILLDGMRGRAARARLGEGRMFTKNCFTNLELTVRRGNVTLSYDWWEERKFSARANVTQGNAWVFLPGEAAFHLFAKTAEGKITGDFDESALTGSAPVGMQIDRLINGGGHSAINIRVQTGNIKIMETNP
jgi:hypothetical protein